MSDSESRTSSDMLSRRSDVVIRVLSCVALNATGSLQNHSSISIILINTSSYNVILKLQVVYLFNLLIMPPVVYMLALLPESSKALHRLSFC